MVRVSADTVEFHFRHPLAHQVCLVGDFNQWRADELRMGRLGEGHWVARLHLPPGKYRFAYLADGRRFDDYDAFGVLAGPGGTDSLLWVNGPPLEPAREQPAARQQCR